jgi:hypothetical protein
MLKKDTTLEDTTLEDYLTLTVKIKMIVHVINLFQSTD